MTQDSPVAALRQVRGQDVATSGAEHPHDRRQKAGLEQLIGIAVSTAPTAPMRAGQAPATAPSAELSAVGKIAAGKRVHSQNSDPGILAVRGRHAAPATPAAGGILARHGARLARFTIVGGTVFCAGVLAQTVLVIAGAGSVVSYVAQAVFCAELSFALNRQFTWGDRDCGFWRALGRWNIQKVLMTVPNLGLYVLLVRLGVSWLTADIATSALFVPVNYITGDLWSFAVTLERHPPRRTLSAPTVRAARTDQLPRTLCRTPLKPPQDLTDRAGPRHPRTPTARVPELKEAGRPTGIPWGPPRYWPFTVAYILLVAVTGWFTAARSGFLGWELTIIWCWPAANTIFSIRGIALSRKALRGFWLSSPPGRQHDLLIITVPTIGRYHVLPALRRSLASHATSFPAWFSNFRIDVVIDEGCEAADDIRRIVAEHDGIARVITVPGNYRTQNGTRFKARANHYANEVHKYEGSARDDVWILHMDDDTGTCSDTARALAAFVEAQRRAGRRACHLAQGVLTYPRQLAANWFTWLADSVRPADDLSRFCAWTGTGTPRAGLHGELLFVRASVEAEIGWDFGPEAIVEDAWFAMIFTQRYAGRSCWLPGRCYGASPATVRDFIRQRERWARGLLHLCANPLLSKGSRLYLAYSLTTWVLGPLQNTVTVIAVQVIVFSLNGSPVSVPVVLIWALNTSYYIWCYSEGLRTNAMASGGTRSWRDRIAVLILLPVFSMMEGIAGLIALFKFSGGQEPDFTVIAKPS